jgi:tripartite-type tricarboxylate transporter receptor subunit TctC
MTHFHQRRRLLHVALAASMAGIAGMAHWGRATEKTSAWPTKPIRYIVPFLPGGMADTMARLVASELADKLGQPINVENRPGGNAMIGYDAVASAPADGYTWLAITLTHAVNQTLFAGRHPPIAKAFLPVARLASSPLVVVVNPNVPANSLKELLALAKKRVLNAGSSGNGSPPHLGMAMLEMEGGVNFNHIPYKGGAPSITDLLAGQIDLIVSNHPECIAHVKAGKLRPLAVTAATRIASLPDVPTTKELGFESVQIENWTGLLMPANTPESVVMKLTQSLDAAMNAPGIKNKIDVIGFSPTLLTGQAFQQFIVRETERWGHVVRSKKIQVE